jgi:hypothetical protein
VQEPRGFKHLIREKTVSRLKKRAKRPLNGNSATGINETLVQLSDRSFEYACENLHARRLRGDCQGTLTSWKYKLREYNLAVS